MKTLLVSLVSIAALAAPAAAERKSSERRASASSPKKAAARSASSGRSVKTRGDLVAAAPDPAPKDLTGGTYELGARRSAEPAVGAARGIKPKSADTTELAEVIRNHRDEIEYCWLRVPAKKRVAASATMQLAIEASGAVAGVTFDGELPAGVEPCIEKFALKWTFPAADGGSIVEHAITLDATSDTLKK